MYNSSVTTNVWLQYGDSGLGNAGGGLFSFGSYRLGVVGPGDDIDVLCIAPATPPSEPRENGDDDCGRIALFKAMEIN